MTPRRLIVAVFMVFCLALPAAAGSPVLTNLLPPAGQRGQTIDVTFYGSRLDDAASVLFHTRGITASEVAYDEKRKNRVHAKLTLAPDCPIGEHQVRLVTRSGVTEMISFRVIDRPIIKEQRDEPNKNNRNRFNQSTSFEDPQPVELGKSVLGRTEPEDVDYFAVELAKGQRFSAQIDGMRLGRAFTDSHLAVLDADRKQVVESDDTALLRQDPYVSFVAPEAGRYVITVRDSGYQGGTNNWYLLHLGSFPRPAVVFPLGGRPGERVDLRFIGDAGGDFNQQVTLPGEPDNGFKVVPAIDGRPAPSGHPFRVNRLNNVIEDFNKPNDSMQQMEGVQAYDAPAAFNGIIEKPGDYDYYKIKLKKGQDVTVRCFASSMGSPLDSVVNVYNAADKKHIQGNDDQGGPDSTVAFKAPQDGEYFVRVRDHRGRSGPEFVYRIEATVATPWLATAVTRYDRNRPQSRQAIAVPKGNRAAALISVRRSRVGGDITPQIDGLPAGVRYIGLGPGQQGNLMPVVFEATGDAPLDARLVNIQAVSAPKGESAEQVVGNFSMRTPLVMGNPNRTEYYFSTLSTHPVAVVEAVPASIEVVQPQSPIVHGGRKHLKVKVTRDEGFEGRVILYPLYRPPGIGATGQVNVNKGQAEGVFNLDANGGVPLRTWPMVIYGYVEMPTGPVWISSQVFEMQVEQPFVGGALQKADCQQGRAVDIVVKLEHPRQWDGEGELKLLGLPAGVKAEPLKIKPGQETATFKVQTADNTPRGTHKTLMCELTIQVNGEPVIHRFGQGGRLRIDRPRVAKNETQARAEGGE